MDRVTRTSVNALVLIDVTAESLTNVAEVICMATENSLDQACADRVKLQADLTKDMTDEQKQEYHALRARRRRS